MYGCFQKQNCAKATDALRQLCREFYSEKHPIAVNFRALVDWFPSADRLTHLIHPYPAKLLMHIPHFFLSGDLVCEPGGTVLDPFAGTGTVLLEAMLSGRNAVGADPNPIAQLVTRVKTTPICPKKLLRHFRLLMQSIPKNPATPPPSTHGLDLEYWFLPPVVSQLQCIREAIESMAENEIRDFFWVCFSSTVRKVSLADPRLSVPVRLNPAKYPSDHPLREKSTTRLERLKSIEVSEVFSETSTKNMRRMNELWDAGFRVATAVPLFEDARNLSRTLNGNDGLADGAIDCIITSPPYAGAQKYVRAQSLSMAWLGMLEKRTLVQYKQKTIGREDYRQDEYKQPEFTEVLAADELLEKVRHANPLRAHILADYLNSMALVLEEGSRVLADNGTLILVSGNNTVCGLEVPTSSFLRKMAENEGFKVVLSLVDDIRSRGLMTKRNKTAGLITQEWVTVFRKRES